MCKICVYASEAVVVRRTLSECQAICIQQWECPDLVSIIAYARGFMQSPRPLAGPCFDAAILVQPRTSSVQAGGTPQPAM